ncbi:MAG: XisI protein [Okeania sp. SIO2F4]|nr:XisI protein [Okeania sp. SIO2F4]
MHEDGLEDGIANDLVNAGLPKSQIVLGFHPPEVRPHTEFAVNSFGDRLFGTIMLHPDFTVNNIDMNTTTINSGMVIFHSFLSGEISK